MKPDWGALVEQDMPSRATLRLFGSPCLIDGAGCRIALPSKAYVLALYLLTSAQSHEVSRVQAASFLWPEAPNPPGNLRQFLRRLKKDQDAAGLELFAIDATNIRLDLGSVDVDVVTLRGELSALDWSNADTTLKIYRDGLLVGPAALENEVANWIDVQRMEIRTEVVAAAVALLGRPDAKPNLRTAQRVALRLLEIEPAQEAGYRALMQIFAHDGKTASVIDTFRRCETILAEEYSAKPSPETLALYHALVPSAGVSNKAGASPATAAPPTTLDDLVRRATLPRLAILQPPPAADEDRRDMASLVLDDVVITLCSLKTISILPSHTASQLGPSPDQETTEKYNIGYLLQPELRRAGATTRLYVQLSNTGRQSEVLWADTYRFDESTTADCHKGIAVHLTRSLADAVERIELERFGRDDNPRAYYWHLYGQKYLRFMDLPNVRHAAKAFRNSLAADPDFAPAHSGKARAIQREWLVLGRGDTMLLDEAERSGLTAVSLDHRDARGYRELGLCSLYRRRWDDAVSNFSEAERLSPQYADLISDFGDTLGHCGEPEQGLTKIKRAMELNPIPPDQYWWNAAGLHFQLHEYREAIADVEQMGHTLPALRIAAAAWAYLGEKEQAKRCSREFLESYPDFRIDHWLSIVPDKRADDRRHYEVGLRNAGFQ